MKRHHITIAIAFFVLVVSASSQIVEVYRDNFDDNKGHWPITSNQQGVLAIGSGVYELERRVLQGDWFLETKAFVDYGTDFDIEIRYRHMAGSTSQPVGIAWGAASAQYANVALLRADGQCKVQSWIGGVQNDVVRWSPISEFPPSGSWVTFTVRRRGSGMSLLVDGATVLGFDNGDIMGGVTGIIIGGQQRVQIDHFVIREPNRPLALADDYPRDTKRENLGASVNCEGGDLSPVITASGKRLYFGRYPFRGNIGDPSAEDIWYTDLGADGNWGPAQNIGRPLNNHGANFLISITPDENSALVGNTYWPNGAPKSAGVSQTVRTADGWSMPVEVRIDNYYNNNRFSEMCLDPSGEILMMAVERVPTMGQRDLFISRRKANGSFGEPINCGKQINSWGNEMSPFIAADGRTVYFATDGRRGYGSVDIWMAKRLDDTWMNWSEPKNLGPIVNTPEWDAYFTVPANGEYAYLSGTNSQNNSADLYRVRLTKGVSPEPVVLITGRVLDAATKKPIATTVEYESLTKRVRVGTARSEPKEGSYKIVLPSGDLYGFRAEAEGYYPVSDQLDTRSLNSYTEISRDLLLAPIRKDARIVLNNLFFDFGSAVLREESLPELDRLASFLLSRSSVVIELGGHTDNVGNDAANTKLSLDRVNAVRTYLVGKGVPEARQKTVGYGKTKPLASNASEEGRQKNRRVEFRIVSL